MYNRYNRSQTDNQKMTKQHSMKKKAAELTFEEGFKLIAQPLDLTDMEV